MTGDNLHDELDELAYQIEEEIEKNIERGFTGKGRKSKTQEIIQETQALLDGNHA